MNDRAGIVAGGVGAGQVTVPGTAGVVAAAAGGGAGTLGLYSIFRSGVGVNRIAGAPILAIGPLPHFTR